MKNFLLTIFIALVLPCYGTHTNSGFITYEQITQFTFKVEVVLFQDASSPAIQRNEIVVDYGDGSTDTIIRQSLVTINSSNNTVKSNYVSTHTYAGAGNYQLSVSDPNRPGGIDNMNNSSSVNFYAESELTVSPLPAYRNNSPRFIKTANSSAFVGQALQLNLMAYDTDRDFLKYQLTNTKGIGGSTAPGYQIPNGAQMDTLSGQFTWTPTQAGTYIFTAVVYEYREHTLIGRTTVDFLIQVNPGFNTKARLSLNSPELRFDSCGTKSMRGKAGDTLNFTFVFDSLNFNQTPITLNFFTDGGPPNALDSSLAFNNNTDSMSIEVQYILDGKDAACAPYPIYVRGKILNSFNFDQQLFIYVQDSVLRSCDSICYIESVKLREHSQVDPIEVEVYPNPMNHQTCFTLKHNQQAEVYFLEVFDSNGKKRMRESFDKEDQVIIHRKGLASGVYFYRIFNADQSAFHSGKLILK